MVAESTWVTMASFVGGGRAKTSTNVGSCTRVCSDNICQLCVSGQLRPLLWSSTGSQISRVIVLIKWGLAQGLRGRLEWATMCPMRACKDAKVEAFSSCFPPKIVMEAWDSASHSLKLSSWFPVSRVSWSLAQLFSKFFSLKPSFYLAHWIAE